jgi:hypothetical protein
MGVALAAGAVMCDPMVVGAKAVPIEVTGGAGILDAMIYYFFFFYTELN